MQSASTHLGVATCRKATTFNVQPAATSNYVAL